MWMDNGDDYYFSEIKAQFGKMEWREMNDYKEIARKLWEYICIIDTERETYEELADAIGLSADELPLCRRLERE